MSERATVGKHYSHKTRSPSATATGQQGAEGDSGGDTGDEVVVAEEDQVMIV